VRAKEITITTKKGITLGLKEEWEIEGEKFVIGIEEL